jgi:hypothetical protein
MLIEPWNEELSALRAHIRDGSPTVSVLILPNIIAKEFFGARLAFDAADDATGERMNEVISRLFGMLGGETVWLGRSPAGTTVVSAVTRHYRRIRGSPCPIHAQRPLTRPRR